MFNTIAPHKIRLETLSKLLAELAGTAPMTSQTSARASWASAGFTSVNFRKAIAYAFDYDALIQIENNAAKLMDSPFPNAMTSHIAVPGRPRPATERRRTTVAL